MGRIEKNAKRDKNLQPKCFGFHDLKQEKYPLLPQYQFCIVINAIKFSLTRSKIPGGVLPYKGVMGTCGQPGYVFRDFCLKQGIKFIIFCHNQGIDLSIFVLNRISFLGR